MQEILLGMMCRWFDSNLHRWCSSSVVEQLFFCRSLPVYNWESANDGELGRTVNPLLHA